MFLIAEAGNCHFGSIEMAKQMILTGKECGADAVKFQAIDAKIAKLTGSMPKKFYEDVAFSEDQYIELINYGRDVGIEVFMSIFGKFARLKPKMSTWKVSGCQVRNNSINLKNYDKSHCIISIPSGIALPSLNSASILHVSDYCTDEPFLDRIDLLRHVYKNNLIGYSDHTKGINTCLKAVKEFGADIIEKHFTLDPNITYNGRKFRDQIHAADPVEFEKLAKGIKCTKTSAVQYATH